MVELAARSTIDLATALFPGLLYERLDELGLDFSVVYPSLGLVFLHTPDEHYRRGACRALNRCNAETFAPFADRLAPGRRDPDAHPGRGRRRARVRGRRRSGSSRCCAPATCSGRSTAGEAVDPSVARWATGSTSSASTAQYDYDPVWAEGAGARRVDRVPLGLHRAQPAPLDLELRVQPPRLLAEGQQSLAKSLFLGGVTRRFPGMNFAFLEGGVAWAASLYSDIIGHWEKRNINALREHLDPRSSTAISCAEFIAKYAPATADGGGLTTDPREPDDMLDEWAACGIERAEDIKTLFVDPFYFGCEADDPLTSTAFNTASTRSAPRSTR